MVGLEGDAHSTPSQLRKRLNPPLGGEGFIFSPGFRSMAAMAGWDEESIIIASLTVEDTPERGKSTGCKRKKQSPSQSKTPPSSNSRSVFRKRRICERKPMSTDNLDADRESQTIKSEEDAEKKSSRSTMELKEDTAKFEIETKDKKPENESKDSSSNSALPCMDKLREELSCAICLEICFEPSTTSCGHSFCKKCLRSAADKCGKKCPKCRQLIINGRACTVNTVLWNTIQLLFPKEVEERKGTGSNEKRKGQDSSSGRWRKTANYARMRSSEAMGIRRNSHNIAYRRSLILEDDDDAAVSQDDDDAGLALRLQREEFMGAFQSDNSSVSVARANLRAMASRAIRVRMGETNNARTTRSRFRSSSNFESRL